jgi:hypothetical protein
MNNGKYQNLAAIAARIAPAEAVVLMGSFGLTSAGKWVADKRAKCNARKASTILSVRRMSDPMYQGYGNCAS